MNVQNPQHENPLSARRNAGGTQESESTSQEKPGASQPTFTFTDKITQRLKTFKTLLEKPRIQQNIQPLKDNITQWLQNVISQIKPAQQPERQSKQQSELTKIYYCCENSDRNWLTNQFEEFSISGLECISPLPLRPNLKAEVEKASTAVLYSSHLSVCKETIKTFLDFRKTCRKRNIVIIAGLMNNSNAEKEKIEEWKNEHFLDFDLFTLTQQEMDTISNQPTNTSAWTKLDEKIKDIRPERTFGKIPILGKLDIGIFSRSSESEYSWLVDLLRSADFNDCVQSVTPCYISNSGFQKFRDDVSGCRFGFLYHTKNRGRINVTDVTDSLYDEELQYLHDKLGRNHVIVVIDDLEDSSEQEKERILASQPSIKAQAWKLLLFSHDEKLILKAKTKIKQLRVLIKDTKDSSSGIPQNINPPRRRPQP